MTAWADKANSTKLFEPQLLGANSVDLTDGGARHPWLRPFANELVASLGALRARIFLSALLYDINVDTILEQADDPAHQPWRDQRQRDPKTFRFADIKDPILPAEIISGLQVLERLQNASHLPTFATTTDRRRQRN